MDKEQLERITERCRIRLKRKLGRRPTADELENCILSESYREEHGLPTKEPKKPSQAEMILEVVKEKLEDIKSDRERQRRLALEDLEDLRSIENINRELAEWGSGEEPRPSREEEMKKLSEEINENLNEQSWKGICSRCRSSVCRCGEDE